MLDCRPAVALMKDEDSKRWVRLNLPHARTVAQRIGRSLEALSAFGEKGNGHGIGVTPSSGLESDQAALALQDVVFD